MLTDQGHNFESDLLKELCEIAQVKKIRTSGYHPQKNGQCKHFNASLINMLGTLPEKPKSTWRNRFPHYYMPTIAQGIMQLILVHIISCLAKNQHLLIGILFGTNTADLKGNTSTKYVKNLKWRIEWAYKTANEVVKKEQEWNKWHYDCRVRCTQMKVGDKVLLKCTAFKGKHKIQDRWENTIYEVIEKQLGKILVFKIKSTEGDNKMKVVHRYLLLPLFSDPSDHTSELDNKSMVDQIVRTHEVIAGGAIASHVQNMGVYRRAQVTNMLHKGLEFVTALFE